MKRDGRLLIVENNPLIARAIEEAGTRLDLRSDCATDGWEAIEKLEAGDYDAIVINTDLPRHSGYGVLTYLREEAGDHLHSVILMTGSDLNALQQRVVGEHVRVMLRTDEVSEIERAIADEMQA